MYPKLLEDLITQFTKLPGIGRRSAERIVFWLLNEPDEASRALSEGIIRLKQGLRFCSLCNNFSEGEVCLVCKDMNRERETICVVENPKDVLAIERTGMFKGRYFVLLGVISPSEGRGPEDIHLHKLLRIVREEGVKEVVIATDPDAEGEMTSLHITRELKPLGVRVSRIGLGIPMGSSVEFADLSTLSMSLNSRRVID